MSYVGNHNQSYEIGLKKIIAARKKIPTLAGKKRKSVLR